MRPTFSVTCPSFCIRKLLSYFKSFIDHSNWVAWLNSLFFKKSSWCRALSSRRSNLIMLVSSYRFSFWCVIRSDSFINMRLFCWLRNLLYIWHRNIIIFIIISSLISSLTLILTNSKFRYTLICWLWNIAVSRNISISSCTSCVFHCMRSLLLVRSWWLKLAWIQVYFEFLNFHFIIIFCVLMLHWSRHNHTFILVVTESRNSLDLWLDLYNTSFTWFFIFIKSSSQSFSNSFYWNSLKKFENFYASLYELFCLAFLSAQNWFQKI